MSWTLTARTCYGTSSQMGLGSAPVEHSYRQQNMRDIIVGDWVLTHPRHGSRLCGQVIRISKQFYWITDLRSSYQREDGRRIEKNYVVFVTASQPIVEKLFSILEGEEKVYEMACRKVHETHKIVVDRAIKDFNDEEAQRVSQHSSSVHGEGPKAG